MTEPKYIIPDAHIQAHHRSALAHRHGGPNRSTQHPKRRFPFDGLCSILESTPETYKIPYAPIFFPTAEEFEDPIAYVEKIRPVAEFYGICKIVPPEDYDISKDCQDISDLGIHENNFHFTTKIQKINNLLYRSGNKKDSNNNNKSNINGTTSSSPPQKKTGTTSSLSPLSSQRRASDGDTVDRTHNKGTSRKRRKLNVSYKTQQTSEQLQMEDNEGNGSSINRDHDEDEDNFGFERTRQKTSLHQFRQTADRFRRQYFTSRIEHSKREDAKYLAPGSVETTIRNRVLPRPQLRRLARKGGIQRVSSVIYFDNYNDVSDGDIESEYWRIVERVDDNMPEVSVQYGSDLINMPLHDNSCFPRHWSCNWALSKLPIVDNSMLKYLYMNVPGITSPMLYVGMLFSSFCWHVEDHFLNAINYLHYGAKKTWYGIPGGAAEKFEQFMRERFPGLFSANPKLLECLVTMVNPRVLIENDIPVYRMIHEPGTYIITFPRAYHSGFNHGFNIAESTNFAAGEWLPWGRICTERYYLRKRPSAFSQDQIVLTALQHLDSFSYNVRTLVCQEARDVIRFEQELRARLKLEREIVKIYDMPNTKKNPHLTRRAAVRDNRVCTLCLQDCYLSAVVCSACFEASKRTAARHGGSIHSMNHDGDEESDADQKEDDQMNGSTSPDGNRYLCLRCVLKNHNSQESSSVTVSNSTTIGDGHAINKHISNAEQVQDWKNLCEHKNRQKLCLLIRFTDDQLKEMLEYALKNPTEPTSHKSNDGKRSTSRKRKLTRSM